MQLDFVRKQKRPIRLPRPASAMPPGTHRATLPSRFVDMAGAAGQRPALRSAPRRGAARPGGLGRFVFSKSRIGTRETAIDLPPLPPRDRARRRRGIIKQAGHPLPFRMDQKGRTMPLRSLYQNTLRRSPSTKKCSLSSRNFGIHITVPVFQNYPLKVRHHCL